MTDGADGLIARAVEGTARPHKWLGVAFGRRFFLLMGVGLIWIVPAFADPRAGIAMLAWDGIVFAAWVIDLLQVRRARPLVVRRSWSAPAALSVEGTVELTLTNESAAPVHATLVDGVPQELRTAPPAVRVSVQPQGRATASYTVRPATRGQVTMGDAFLRCQGPMRFAEWWLRAPPAQQNRVYPNLDEA